MFSPGDRIRYECTGDDGLPLVRYGFVGGVAASGGPVVVMLDGGWVATGEPGQAPVTVTTVELVRTAPTSSTPELHRAAGAVAGGGGLRRPGHRLPRTIGDGECDARLLVPWSSPPAAPAWGQQLPTSRRWYGCVPSHAPTRDRHRAGYPLLLATASIGVATASSSPAQ